MLGLLKDAQDSKPNLTEQDTTITTIRGMIYISLYATLEYCITQGVQTLLNFISSSQIRYAHLEYSFNAVALDPLLSSVQNAGGKKKWPSRRALFAKLADTSICTVPDTAFGTFLHNVWPETIEEIFLCFGIDSPPTPTSRERAYLTEIVEKRNAIAHGRDTASEASEGLTVTELRTRMDAVYQECIYFLSILEEHAADLRFIRPRHRRMYRTVT
jgi:hypothetical protein